MIEKFIEHLPGFKEEALEPDSKAILRAIAAQHGIFVERAQGVYSFAHLTFQEYFTAKYLVEHGRLEELVEQHLDDAKWKGVFLLSAGLVDSADELLVLMRRKADEILDMQEINTLLQTAGASLLPNANKYPAVIRRSTAVFIIIKHAVTRALDLDLIRALTRALDLNLIRDLDLDLISDHGLVRALVRALALDRNLLLGYAQANNLNQQIISKIEDYLAVNLLMINCITSANFVSKPIREKMLHEMFLPKQG